MSQYRKTDKDNSKEQKAHQSQSQSFAKKIFEIKKLKQPETVNEEEIVES